MPRLVPNLGGRTDSNMATRDKLKGSTALPPSSIKNWGYVREHKLRVEKKPPDSVIELRELLTYPEHHDIFLIGMKQKSFEESIGAMLAELKIGVDGAYDGEELCALLAKALRHRGKSALEIDPNLVRAQLIEGDGTVKLKQQDHFVVQPSNDAFSVFMREHGCAQCDNTALCKRNKKCLGEESRMENLTREQKDEANTPIPTE